MTDLRALARARAVDAVYRARDTDGTMHDAGAAAADAAIAVVLDAIPLTATRSIGPLWKQELADELRVTFLDDDKDPSC